MVTTRSHRSKTDKAARKLREPRALEGAPKRSVEDMLQEISLVLWLTRRVKEDILADAAPQRGNLAAATTEAVAAE